MQVGMQVGWEWGWYQEETLPHLYPVIRALLNTVQETGG